MPKTRKSRKKLVKAAKLISKPKSRVKKTELEQLELMLFFTERAVQMRGSSGLDKGMIAQAERLRNQIAQLRARKA
jgi:hypothetical protein